MELSKPQIHTLIYYNWKRKLTVEDCKNEMDNCLSTQSPSNGTIRRWYLEFGRGRVNVEQEKGAGRPRTATTPENVSRVRKMVEKNPSIGYWEIMRELKIGSAAVTTILHEHLKMRKILCKWIPHKLSPEQKNTRLEMCKKNLKLFKDGGHRFVSRILTLDETYVSVYDAPARNETRVWVLENEDAPSLVKVSRSTKKLMFTVSFRSTGLVKCIRLTGQKTVTAKYFMGICLPETLKDVHRKDLLVHFDNAPAHTAKVTLDYLASHNLKTMDHPPYSPDLAPCDFWLFSRLKRSLRGRRFADEDEVEEAVNEYFETITKGEWLECFKMWQKRMERCIQVQGDYFE